MRRAVLACCIALATGLAIGLIASSGGDAGADALRPAGVRLERLATPSVGAIDVPALKVGRKPTRPVTPPPPPPVTPVPPPVTPVPPPVTPVPPPPVVQPPPPPSIIVVPG